ASSRAIASSKLLGADFFAMMGLGNGKNDGKGSLKSEVKTRKGFSGCLWVCCGMIFRLPFAFYCGCGSLKPTCRCKSG
ncbi:MAG: hypothetical protein ACFNS8_06295, partial [Kingella oralis]